MICTKLKQDPFGNWYRKMVILEGEPFPELLMGENIEGKYRYRWDCEPVEVPTATILGMAI